jgi:hypothetical protein
LFDHCRRFLDEFVQEGFRILAIAHLPGSGSPPDSNWMLKGNAE